MGRKSKKTELLEIMKNILDEYENKNHYLDVKTCGLCVKFMGEYSECSKCPMSVFGEFTPCLDRKCKPIECHGYMSSDDSNLKRVIKFYEKVFTKIESMSTDAVRKSSFKFLIKFDEEVYNSIS